MSHCVDFLRGWRRTASHRGQLTQSWNINNNYYILTKSETIQQNMSIQKKVSQIIIRKRLSLNYLDEWGKDRFTLIEHDLDFPMKHKMAQY